MVEFLPHFFQMYNDTILIMVNIKWSRIPIMQEEISKVFTHLVL